MSPVTVTCHDGTQQESSTLLKSQSSSSLMMFSQEADQEGLLRVIYCIFSLADCGGCILLNYLMQRFKTFPLEAFNSDSGKIKF